MFVSRERVTNTGGPAANETGFDERCGISHFKRTQPEEGCYTAGPYSLVSKRCFVQGQTRRGDSRKPAARVLWQLQGDLWSSISQIKSEPLIHGKVPTLQREEGSSAGYGRRGHVTQTTTFTEINTHWIQLLALIPVTSKWKRRPRQNSKCDLTIYNQGTGRTFSRIRDEDGIFNTAFTSGV